MKIIKINKNGGKKNISTYDFNSLKKDKQSNILTSHKYKSIKKEKEIKKDKQSNILISDKYKSVQKEKEIKKDKQYKINNILNEFCKIQNNKIKNNKFKIISGNEYKKNIFLNDLDNYFDIDNIYSKNYDLFHYVNNEYIDDVINELIRIKDEDNLSTSEIKKNKFINIIDLFENKKKSKISGGSTLSTDGSNLLKCLNIFDAKHDFTKKDNNQKLLVKYIDEIGNKKIDDNFSGNPVSINEIKDLFNNNLQTYEYNILNFIITKINHILTNNIDINNFSFISIPNDIMEIKISDTIVSNPNNVVELIKFIKKFFNYEKLKISDCKYIFDTSIKIHKNLRTIIKENILNDDDNDDEDNDDDIDNDEININPSLTNNLYNKLGVNIQPFENAFDPHPSNDIIIDNSIIYSEYVSILNENFNYDITRSNIKEEQYSINILTRKNFIFHIYPFEYDISNIFIPCIGLIRFRENNNIIFANIFKYLDTTIDIINTIDYTIDFDLKIKNTNFYLFFRTQKPNSIYIRYDKSFNSKNNLKEAIEKIIKIEEIPYLDNKKNYIKDLIKNNKFSNNNLLNILIIYLIISETNNFTNIDFVKNIYNVIDILLDLKKAGDWGQSLFCSKLNKKNSSNNTFFISGDQLSASRSILCGNVNTIFSCKEQLGLFKSNNINTFNDFHKFIVDNIYKQDIFKDIFDIYKDNRDLNNPLFFANNDTSIKTNTNINNTNINFNKLNNLLLILFYITILHLNYNSVFKYNGNTLIKLDVNNIENIDYYLIFFTNDLSKSNLINILNLINTSDKNIHDEFENSLLYKDYDDYKKIFHTFYNDYNGILPSNPDLNLYIKSFLNFIDIINIYNTLICYDKSNINIQRNFNSIIKNKQINFSKNICELLTNLELINYTEKDNISQNFEYEQIELYIKQSEYDREPINQFEKFNNIIEKLGINDFIIEDNFIVSFSNISDETSIAYYNYIRIIIDDLYKTIDIWKTFDSDDYKEIENFLINYAIIEPLNRKEKNRYFDETSFYKNILERDYESYIIGNPKKYNILLSVIKTERNKVKITNLKSFFNEIINLLNNTDVALLIEINILKTLFYNVFIEKYNIRNIKSLKKIIKIHNEYILPEITYINIFKTYIHPKKNIMINLLRELFTFNIKKFKYTNIENNSFFYYSKFKEIYEKKLEEYNQDLLKIENNINQIKFKKYMNIISIHNKNEIKFDLIFNCKDIYITNDINIIQLFNFFIFIPYIKEYRPDILASNPTLINYKLSFNNNTISDSTHQLFDIYIEDCIKKNNIQIEYEKIFKIFIDLDKLINKNLKNKLADVIKETDNSIKKFCFLYETLFINIFNLADVNKHFYSKNKDYGYNENNILELKTVVENIFRKNLTKEQANYFGINRRDRKNYIDSGIEFLINDYKTSPFNLSRNNSMQFKDLFKYISANTFIIKKLVEILKYSSDNIFDLLKKNYHIYDNLKIKDIAIEYYKSDIDFEKDIIEIIYIFLRGVISFYDKIINSKKSQSNNFIIKLYKTTSSKDLKIILSKLDYMIKYTNGNSLSEIIPEGIIRDFSQFQRI